MQQFKINGKIINVPSNVSFTFDESGIPSFVVNPTRTNEPITEPIQKPKNLFDVFSIETHSSLADTNKNFETVNNGRNVALTVRTHFNKVGARGLVQAKNPSSIYGEFSKQGWSVRMKPTSNPKIWDVSRIAKSAKRRGS